MEGASPPRTAKARARKVKVEAKVEAKHRGHPPTSKVSSTAGDGTVVTAPTRTAQGFIVAA